MKQSRWTEEIKYFQIMLESQEMLIFWMKLFETSCLMFYSNGISLMRNEYCQWELKNIER